MNYIFQILHIKKYLINQIINYIKPGDKTFKNIEGIKRIKLFNKLDLIQEYENILLEIENSKLLNDEKKLESLEKMAIFCDKLSSYVIQFLNQNSIHMKI